MVYAVADLFLLARNPGPTLRSTFSSFSDFAYFYRSRLGRLAGPGFVADGCSDTCGGGDNNLLSKELSTSSQRRVAAVRLLPPASAQAFATAAASKASVLALASAMATPAGSAAEETLKSADESLVDADSIRGLAVCATTDEAQQAA